MLICVGSGRVGASRGPEVRGSKPSAFPHLTIAMLDECSVQLVNIKKTKMGEDGSKPGRKGTKLRRVQEERVPAPTSPFEFVDT